MTDADWKKYKRLRGADLPAEARFVDGNYRLETLFKHDFYAATALYQKITGNGPDRLVLKVYHTEPWGFLSLAWLGRWLYQRETKFYTELKDIAGIPTMLESFGATGFVREYVDGENLREYAEFAGKKVNADFFPTLQAILAEVHARGIAHNDLSKPENLLVANDGSPVLIDFQIASMPKRWPFVMRLFGRPMLRYMHSVDYYHFCKHYRRYRGEDISAEVRKAGTRRAGLLTLHYYFIRAPYRFVRHLLRDLFLKRAPETTDSTIKEAQATSAPADNERKAA